MEIRVLTPDLIAKGIVDTVDSFIWTERYQQHGDFEIYTNFDPYLWFLFTPESVVQIPQSKRSMIIETRRIKSNPETGNKIVISGRSLESILDRRILIGQTLIDGSLQDGIEQILDENLIDSSQPIRNIPGFIFSPSVDPVITGLTVETQYDGNEVYEIIKNLAEQAGFGFKVILDASNNYVFSLYLGADRSYNQSTNPYVVFSPEFDNLISSEFFETVRHKKTYALLFGDNTAGPAHRVEAHATLSATGLARREVFVDASDMSKFIQGTTTEIDPIEYTNQVRQRGLEYLAANGDLMFFEGQVDLSRTYTYDVDFFLGDIIQMVDYYGNAATSQVLEITFSEDANGYRIYPSLKSV